MHVAIVGAGALGRVYGVRLALLASVGVTFVVRAGKEGDASALRIVRIDGEREEHVLEKPERAASVPANADVVIVCVRVEQLDDALIGVLRERAELPVVVLTPLLPADFARLKGVLGERVLAGMPGVVSYVTAAGVCRYWLPTVAPTLIDDPRGGPHAAALEELVSSLERAGLHARLELGVHETNPATTVSFIPLAMGLDAGGSIDGVLKDRALLSLAVSAAREGLDLSKRIGKSAAWVGVLTRFVGPTTLRMGIALARSRWPEAVMYVEEHFGRKLHAQNVLMAEAMVRLAEEKGTPHAALSELYTRLRARQN